MTNNADLIAEARDFVQMGSGINIMEADRLIEELSRELEAAERRADTAREEVGYEKRMREFISGERDRFIDLKRAVEQDRNQLAAVVGKVRDYLEEGKGAYAPDLLDILTTAPADALREVKAEVWDEGHSEGREARYQDEHTEWMASGLHESDAVNPYREEQS